MRSVSTLSIRAIAEERSIPYLVHFTQAPNLPSILEFGIYPVMRHSELPTKPLVNDLLRLDNHRDANCISIGFPNYQMFYRYRSTVSDMDWAVLKLNRSILWSKRCAFCPHNAASAKMRATPLPELVGPSAFERMFDELSGRPSRSDQRLWSYDPTDVQAEVLVLDVIEPSLIQGVVFSSSRAKAKYKQFAEMCPAMEFGVSDMFFLDRRTVRDRS